MRTVVIVGDWGPVKVCGDRGAAQRPVMIEVHDRDRRPKLYIESPRERNEAALRPADSDGGSTGDEGGGEGGDGDGGGGGDDDGGGGDGDDDPPSLILRIMPIVAASIASPVAAFADMIPIRLVAALIAGPAAYVFTSLLLASCSQRNWYRRMASRILTLFASSTLAASLSWALRVGSATPVKLGPETQPPAVLVALLALAGAFGVLDYLSRRDSARPPNP